MEPWAWKCWLCGKQGMTTGMDPFTLHYRTWRHRIVALLKFRSKMPEGTR